MSKPKPFKDPRGHSLRIYSDIFDSAAFKALGPHDVMAYLALLRELKGSNNGDQIRNPNRIYPGQVFRMPDGAAQ